MSAESILGQKQDGHRDHRNSGKERADQAALTTLDYERHLWLETEIKSVANVTRRDVSEFLELAARMRLEPQIEEYPLTAANAALIDLKTRPVMAAKVLKIRH